MDTPLDRLVKAVAEHLTWRKELHQHSSHRSGPSRNAGFAFDDLARALAEGVPRREALRRIGGGLAAAMLASLGSRFAWGQSLDCVGFCNQLPSAEASQCLQDALNGGGLCEACQADATRLCQTATGNHVCCATSNACCNSACCQPGDVCCNQRLSDGRIVLACRGSASFQTDREHCGSCGHACADGLICSGGVCVPCGGGQVFCAGVCCAAGESCCNGICANTQTDPFNCGTCGNVCRGANTTDPNGQVCVQGRCVGCKAGETACAGTCCAAGETCCDGICKNLRTDPSNCGACFHECAEGADCVSGQCSGACSSGETLCGGVCVDTRTDRLNCGSCGKRCYPEETCCDGVCANLRKSPQNCGVCGTVCAAGTYCNNYQCVCRDGRPLCNGACCSANQFCCNGICCANRQSCCDRVCCDPGHVCCNGACCPAGLVCDGGQCGCPSGQSLCNGACIDTRFDARNCGACGRVCSTSEACCTGTCVNRSAFLYDSRNCGSCNNVCPAPTPDCCRGKCVNLQTDSRNCALCDLICPRGAYCGQGTCRCLGTGELPCNEVCCARGQTCCSGVCVNTFFDARNCGACGKVCPVGLNCRGGVCKFP